jgi:hypothetical protein
MPESVDLYRTATDVRNVAKECGARIVEAALSLDTRTVPVAAVDAAEFCGLVSPHYAAHAGGCGLNI